MLMEDAKVACVHACSVRRAMRSEMHKVPAEVTIPMLSVGVDDKTQQIKKFCVPTLSGVFGFRF